MKPSWSRSRSSTPPGYAVHLNFKHTPQEDAALRAAYVKDDPDTGWGRPVCTHRSPNRFKVANPRFEGSFTDSLWYTSYDLRLFNFIIENIFIFQTRAEADTFADQVKRTYTPLVLDAVEKGLQIYEKRVPGVHIPLERVRTTQDGIALHSSLVADSLTLRLRLPDSLVDRVKRGSLLEEPILSFRSQSALSPSTVARMKPLRSGYGLTIGHLLQGFQLQGTDLNEAHEQLDFDKALGQEIAQRIRYLCANVPEPEPLMPPAPAPEIPVLHIEDRIAHTMVAAGSGHGKTQLLLKQFCDDIQLPDPPGMVILDSTGAMVRSIERLAVFDGRLKGRLLIIDPRRDPLPALGMFDIRNPRMQAYSDRERDSIENETVDLFNYVFASADTPITGLQSGPLAFLVRLLLTIPNSNLRTFKQLLQDNPKGGYEEAAFRPHIERLTHPRFETIVEFFTSRYYTQRYDANRDQLLRRIDVIEKNTVLHPILNATIHSIDWFQELNQGSIIVVNTSRNTFRAEMPLFGRYIISKVLAAAFERESIPENNRRPAFLIVDEAADYFDENFNDLLTRVRQFKLGVTIAFQDFGLVQPASLRGIIASCTTVKYAGGVSADDARMLAANMGTDPQFILAQTRDPARPPQRPNWTRYAFFLRNVTPKAVSVTVPFHTIETLPKMSDAQHAAFIKQNNGRLSGIALHETPTPQTPAVDTPTPPPAPNSSPSLFSKILNAIFRDDAPAPAQPATPAAQPIAAEIETLPAPEASKDAHPGEGSKESW